MKKILDCPKCEGKMAKGRLYIVASDVTKPNKMFGYVNWEAADESRFGGMYAYRCDKCGYIEYYAERKQ
jgi:predicted nucleic-acid-binding Zn-ribbon protein